MELLRSCAKSRRRLTISGGSFDEFDITTSAN
jgi:hypothetical protein